MSTESTAPGYDEVDESTSEPGGEHDPAQYDGAGSEDVEETGVTHEPDEPTEEEFDDAEAELEADDGLGEDDD